MILTELRDKVRAQTQTTSGDLSDPLIDWWLQQGFERTINAETRWPFYEQQWGMTLAANATEMALPGDVNPPGIIALIDLDRGVRMQQLPQQRAEDMYPQRVGVSSAAQLYYSIWNGAVILWPIVRAAVSRSFALRGYRTPQTWLNTDQEPDCDPRLHLALIHYAIALAYEQQEDETLNRVYMDRWQRDVEMAHTAIMDPRHHRPLVGAGSIDPPPLPWRPFVVVPPTP